MQQSKSANHFVLLDIVRTVACLAVIFDHLMGTLNASQGGGPSLGWIVLGDLGVTLFIVLSGALLQVHFSSQEYRYKDFMMARIWRIYPVYYICLITVVVLYALYHYRINGAPFYGLHYYDILLSITGFYAFVGLWGGPFLNTSWYIGTIICLYLLFPLLSRLFAWHRLTALSLLLGISAVSVFLLSKGIVPLPGNPVQWFPLCRVFEFGLGMYIAMATNNLQVFRSSQANGFFEFTSKISFPAFLLHFPLLALFPHLARLGVSTGFSVVIYFFFVFVMSWLVAIADDYLQPVVSSKILKIERHQGSLSTAYDLLEE